MSKFPVVLHCMLSELSITSVVARYTHLVLLLSCLGEPIIGGHEKGLMLGIKAGHGTCYCYSEKCFCEQDYLQGELICPCVQTLHYQSCGWCWKI